jgi:hypothetical protein
VRFDDGKFGAIRSSMAARPAMNRSAKPQRRLWLVKLSKPGQMFAHADADPANVS